MHGKNRHTAGTFRSSSPCAESSHSNSVQGASPIRLQLYLARCGAASRRACETFIADGRVSVNGTIITAAGTKVCETDEVRLDGVLMRPESRRVYVLLHKPAGCVCSMADEKGRKTAASLLEPHFSERLYNVGRLDMFSSGLIIFTNDGEFAKRLSHPSSGIEKEYIVKTTVPVPAELAERFEKGIRIEGVFYKCRSADIRSSRTVHIVLVEGKNREIRRVFEHFEIPIRSLTRIRIGSICMENLAEGAFRELSEEECRLLSAY